MDVTREAARGRRRLARLGGALALCLALVVATVPGASAATLSRSWQAKVGTGTATISAYTSGSGALGLKLTGLRASTSYATVLYRGTCSSVGSKLLALASFTTTSGGAATKTSALTSSQVGTITSATSGGNTIAIRVGTGKLSRCGLFTSLPVVAGSTSVGQLAVGLAAGQGGIWVANYADDTVARLDPASGVVLATIDVGDAPFAVAAGEGAIWVTNIGSNTVSRIDPVTGTVTATIPVGMRPLGVAYGAGSVWVVNIGEGTVHRIDPATNTVVGIVVILEGLFRIAATDSAVWVTAFGPMAPADGRVHRIDPLTNAIEATIPVGYDPTGLAVGTDSVYVALEGDTSIARIGIATNTVIGRVNVGMRAEEVALLGDTLWVSHPVGAAVSGAPLFAGAVTRVNL